MQIIIREFEEISGFLQAVEAKYVCHIRVKAPLKDAEDYINRKDYQRIVLQGFVDNYMFSDVFVGWPRKSHDVRILPGLSTNNIFTLSMHLQNTSITPSILGDSAYPLEEFIMKSCADRENLNPQ